MRSTFSVSTWTWTLAGCLALYLGCSQGEGDRCEVNSDCSGDLTCEPTGSTNNGICRRQGTGGAGGSTGQGGTTGTSTSQPDASIQPADAAADASISDPDASVSEPDASAPAPDTAFVD